jgi:hypothetical protein
MNCSINFNSNITEFSGQQSIKYASLNRAQQIALPATSWVIDKMCQLAPTIPVSRILGEPLVDIRYWPELRAGQTPGLPDWHYDVWNDPIKGANDIHMIYILGASCRTQFRFEMVVDAPDGYCTKTVEQYIDEGKIFTYTGADLHRPTPAQKTGPRILIRCSWTNLTPQNNYQKQGYIHVT